MAKDVMSQLKDKGKVTRGWIGVSIQEITPDLAKSCGIKEKKGALVSQVFKDGPADKAGIQQGDVIMEFDRRIIVESKDLPRIVAAIPVGKSVTVKLLRNGNVITKDLKVGEMEEKPVETAKAPSGKRLGIGIQDITPEIARALSLSDTSGVVVTQVELGSAAANAGIRQGDIIREVNRKPVKDSKA
jgi:serine protease Do